MSSCRYLHSTLRTVLARARTHTQTHAISHKVWFAWANTSHSKLFFLLFFCASGSVCFDGWQTIEQKISNKFSPCACSHIVPLVAYHFFFVLFLFLLPVAGAAAASDAFSVSICIRKVFGSRRHKMKMHFNGTENSVAIQPVTDSRSQIVENMREWRIEYRLLPHAHCTPPQQPFEIYFERRCASTVQFTPEK